MCYAHRYQDVIDYKGDNALNMRVTKRTTYRISLVQRIFLQILTFYKKIIGHVRRVPYDGIENQSLVDHISVGDSFQLLTKSRY